MLETLDEPRYHWTRVRKTFQTQFIGDNAMGTDNQQERLDASWIAGFVDGEGCFHVALNRQMKMTLGWQVLPEFRVVQHQRDEQSRTLNPDWLGKNRTPRGDDE